MKKLTIGTLAHVDAGKTTLIESLLYLSNTIKKQGRVDHGDAYLDFEGQERQRGITIFSKEVSLKWNDSYITLLDTPGHKDFSSEMERTLSVLDYAIIVISANDGIQSHTNTLWQLLKHYNIPTFFFINKMDISHYESDEIIQQLVTKFSEGCLDLNNKDSYETIAMMDDSLLDEYLSTNKINLTSIKQLIKERKIFPCFFGSALKNEGVNDFLDALNMYTKENNYLDNLEGTVYKISYDNNEKLTHVKLTGGTLNVKDVLDNHEKIDQIRIYSGNTYQMIDQASAGDIVVLKGLSKYRPGDSITSDNSNHQQLLTPYIQYQVVLPEGYDTFKALSYLREIEDTDPTLHCKYNDDTKEITMELMGEIQLEVLKNLVKEKYNLEIAFTSGSITYKETITKVVEGVGHYEPLRHYSEVHLLLEPGQLGSGIEVVCHLSNDELAIHWQRLITTHIYEVEHLGVLTGSPITDIKITILGAKAHLKHTEPGDFREATYRAIRHGLKLTDTILLEPYYSFELDVPSNFMSKAIYDIENMQGTFEIKVQDDRHVVLTGRCPIKTMNNYQIDVDSYTKGQGQLLVNFDGYRPCTNQQEVIDEYHYDSELDVNHPTGSVFCKHGAGYYVSYNEVYDKMHIGPFYKIKQENKITHDRKEVSDKELNAIFERTYGPIKRKLSYELNQPKKEVVETTSGQLKEECLLVDGYNVIHSWPLLNELAKDSFDGARDKLIDLMCNYQGYRRCLLIVVFDAYLVKQNYGKIEKNNNIYVVYTKEAQTADMYIERVTGDLSKDYRVIVATSDNMERTIVTGRGAQILSSLQLLKEYELLTNSKYEEYISKQPKSINYGLNDLKEKK